LPRVHFEFAAKFFPSGTKEKDDAGREKAMRCIA
jgi:hypothetical protein